VLERVGMTIKLPDLNVMRFTTVVQPGALTTPSPLQAVLENPDVFDNLPRPVGGPNVPALGVLGPSVELARGSLDLLGATKAGDAAATQNACGAIIAAAAQLNVPRPELSALMSAAAGVTSGGAISAAGVQRFWSALQPVQAAATERVNSTLAGMGVAPAAAEGPHPRTFNGIPMDTSKLETLVDAAKSGYRALKTPSDGGLVENFSFLLGWSSDLKIGGR
jgi:hypothetical protein